MFQYPVSVAEIHRFSSRVVSLMEIEAALKRLTDKKYLFRFDELYALQDNRSLVSLRRSGNERAGKLMPVAYRIGKLLSRFPFVKGVGISGSLSKHYADKEADIDFFIITQANHLYIARTLLHCLKKLSFLVGKQHWYCMNYFIDETALLMPEKNIFIATEVVTLKPVFGNTAICSFFSANDWAFDNFPNYEQPAQVVDTRDAWYKQLTEYLFNNRFGDWLDDYLMRVTEKRWLLKEKKHKLNMKGEPMSFRISKHFARPNPEHFQKKILACYRGKLENMRSGWNIDFEYEDHFLRKETI
jgi:hypothetical protein